MFLNYFVYPLPIPCVFCRHPLPSLYFPVENFSVSWDLTYLVLLLFSLLYSPFFLLLFFFEMRSWISILAQPLRAKIILFYFLHYYVQLICDICIYIYVYIHTMYIYVYVLVAIMKSIIWFFLEGEGSFHCIQNYYWLLYVEFHILQLNWVNLFVLIGLFFGGEGKV